MTKLFEEAIAVIRNLPEGEQDLAARFLLGFANPDAPTYRLTADQLAEVEAAIREVDEGKLATDAEMEEVWQRFGR
ncbi:MAG TPA: hypothetical protein VHX19_24935 [Stellaceae bacterium]|jgi:hypothetical protein|nr:hypothetical protein [Stellaceae bacterium]